MSATPSRRLVLTRSIRVRAYAHGDGLSGLEAELAGVLPTAAIRNPRWYTAKARQRITEDQGR